MDYIQQMEDHFVLSTGDIVLIRQRNKKEIRQKVLDYMNSKIKPYRAGEAASRAVRRRRELLTASRQFLWPFSKAAETRTACPAE